MNCKPGDLAIVVKADGYSQFLGRILVVVEPCQWEKNHWRTEPVLTDPVDDVSLVWHDSELRPIRDQPGEDEMIRIAGKPGKVDA